LRKHLRGRRLSSIEQVAFDRVVHLCFGSDFESQESREEHEFHLYLELFAQGNVILTNWEGRILTILRPVDVESTGKLAIGQLYDPYQKGGVLDLKRIENFISEGEVSLQSFSKAHLSAFSPQMIELCLKRSCPQQKNKKTKNFMFSGDEIEQFIESCNALISTILSGNEFVGLLQVERAIEGRDELLDPKTRNLLHSFHPLKDFDEVWEGSSMVLGSFNEAVDVYFTRLDAERNSQREVNCELEATRKLQAIEAEQQSRISGLEAAVELYRVKGQLVTERAEEVESALKVVRSALESGMDWSEFWRLIESEKQQVNAKRAAIASLFVGLKLERGQVTLQLADGICVDVQVGLSAFGNATRLYDLRTQARLKMERTQAVHEVAMKSAAAKIRSEMAQTRQLGRVRQLQSLRKPFWFEKFAWFISSDGFLVLAGRDAQQNELLVKKYLRTGDVYVHADVQGAGSLVVKNHVYPRLSLPPPKTLHEAGTFSICFSRAWEAKIVTSAWWVHCEQVSKTAPSGEYLGTGSFMIRGQKNFLPPMQLSLSFGFLFALDEDARLSKMNERLQREAEGSWPSMENVNYEKYRVEEASVDGSVESEQVIIDTATTAMKAVKLTNSSKQSKSKTKSDSTSTMSTNKKSESESTETPTTKNVRGKHGKQKKMKKKYADQDEEERALRMELLGSSKKQPERERTLMKGEKRDEEVKPVKQISVINESTQTNSISTSQPPSQSNTIEDEDLTSANCNDFIPADYFTLNPETTDQQFPFVLPVCFPTSALSTARFRIKLVPGALKKGKAVKSVLALLTSPSACPSLQWRDLIRAVPENELITVMPAKVALGVSYQETKKLKQKKPKKK
jgi:predicted ribosome quality control (RQC) complex YloA/Tae2 family protein